MNNSTKVALCGIISALCVIVMLITYIFPNSGALVLPTICGLFISVISIEAEQKLAWACYFVVAFISFIFIANKEAIIWFVFFFGYYPTIKQAIESINNKFIRAVLKISIFNLAVVAIFFVATWILGIPAESFTVWGISAPVVLLLCANVMFWLYDKATANFEIIYKCRLQNTIKKIMHL